MMLRPAPPPSLFLERGLVVVGQLEGDNKSQVGRISRLKCIHGHASYYPE
jgi:hypothetical protein